MNCSLPTVKINARERGFSLIELMIALAIGTVLLLTLTVMFSVNSSNQNDLEQTIRKLENARYSLDTMSEDIVHAGYFSDFNPDTLIPPPSYAMPNPCATAVTQQGWATPASGAASIPAAVQGISNVNTTTATCLSNRVPGTAAIVIRRADTGSGTAVGAGIPAGADATTANNLYIQVSGCESDPQRILASPGPASNLSLTMPDCATKANPIRRLIQRTYYIASCNDCTANDGIPTLKRIEMVNGTLQTAAIAEGIENMQFEYGIDNLTPFNGQPDSYESNGTIGVYTGPDWSNVITVRIHMLARNTQKTKGYTDTRTYLLGPDVAVAAPTDGFKRTLMTTTVRLNNVAGRRE